MESTVLTVSEVATQLRIGRTTAYRLISSRELPSIKIGAARRVTRVALEQYVHDLAGAA